MTDIKPPTIKFENIDNALVKQLFDMFEVVKGKIKLMELFGRNWYCQSGGFDIMQDTNNGYVILRGVIEAKSPGEHPPLAGEIAYLQFDCVKYPIIFDGHNWKFCQPPAQIVDCFIIRDEVCKYPRGRPDK